MGGPRARPRGLAPRPSRQRFIPAWTAGSETVGADHLADVAGREGLVDPVGLAVEVVAIVGDVLDGLRVPRVDRVLEEAHGPVAESEVGAPGVHAGGRHGEVVAAPELGRDLIPASLLTK